jgi:hypothetical protein
MYFTSNKKQNTVSINQKTAVKGSEVQRKSVRMGSWTR